MFYIRIADLNIGIDNKYPQLERLCGKYLTDGSGTDFTVSANEADIENEIKAADHPVSAAYAESICIYREICKRLPGYDAFLFHSSVVECDGRSYAFAAQSGTGKSTHTALWLKHFGERARIINGDKPIFRFIDGELKVYGTPWCGKEGYNVNDDSPLFALCFIERGEKNEISECDTGEAVIRMFSQILMPPDEKEIDRLFPLLEKMLTSVPCFVLKCNISDEAVTVAYNAMNIGKDKTI